MAKKVLEFVFANSRCYRLRLLSQSATTNLQAYAACRSCSSEQNKYSYEITKDPAEWKYVEALLPRTIVPPPPTCSCPTPSGWVPQQEEKYCMLPYYIGRTKNHMLPVYLREMRSDPRKFTHIGNITGDIWALDTDVKDYLESIDPSNAPVLTQVHEPGRFIRVKGVHMDQIAQFLLEKGF